MDLDADDSDTLTFVCLASNQVASFVDVAKLRPGRHRAHAQQLFREHASAETIEIWRDDKVWEVIAREGIRTIGAAAATTEGSVGSTIANGASPDA
ncbi:hypothetical protein [Caulobacter sp. RL271]|jgi:hypothetical protein|uniref:Uncharacterized protein n=1 Tax=Caulobacter segnis TaxID=88688 RepID=A0ABY4ZS22_9CAUL|nr:hypothetical protein [Caulobacter segnis]USQ95398.1 hypothetical protein MZV50_23090 [Caulobacter segnis]